MPLLELILSGLLITVPSLIGGWWLGAGEGSIPGVLVAFPGLLFSACAAMVAVMLCLEMLAGAHVQRLSKTARYQQAQKLWSDMARANLIKVLLRRPGIPVEVHITVRHCFIAELPPGNVFPLRIRGTPTEIRNLRRSFLSAFITHCGPISALAVMIDQSSTRLPALSNHEMMEALARGRPSS